MSLSNGKITAPVSVDDVRRCISDSSIDVGSLCTSSGINKWSKYKPVSITAKNTVSGQWDTSNNRWLPTATWWKGEQDSSSTYVKECGFSIPCVSPSSEYRSTAYYQDNMQIPNGWTPPSSVPSGVWTYLSRSVYRLTDFAGYYHSASVPLTMSYPTSPITMRPEDTAVDLVLCVNNYGNRKNGNDCAIFANDMESLNGAEFCAKLEIRDISGGSNNRTYELTGGTLSDNNRNLHISIMKKLLSITGKGEFDVTVNPYLRKEVNNTIKLYSIDCASSSSTTLRFMLPGAVYKMRYEVGEAMYAGSEEGMFGAGFSANLSGIEMYPVADDDTVTAETLGTYISLRNIYAKVIIDDVFNQGGLRSDVPYTINVYVEDLNEGDYLKCMIPKTRILSFTTNPSSGNNLQAYGYRGSAQTGGSGTVNTNLSFVNSRNDGLWTFGTGIIPILESIDEAWPPGPGTINPDNDVIAKFRLIAEVASPEIVSVPQKHGQKGDGSFKKENPTYSPTETMLYWKDSYVFSVKEVTENGNITGYDVVKEGTIGIDTYGPDYSEIGDNFGTNLWMPLPSGWDTAGSIWLTET